MRTHLSPWTIRGLYLLAVILVLFPLIDLFTATWPFRFGELPWRYAAFGVAANHLHLPIAGIALSIAVAHALANRSVMRLAGWLGVVAAGLLVPVMVTFALDVSAMAELRGPEFSRDTLLAGAIQEVKYAFTLIAMGVLGLGALEMARAARSAAGNQGPAPGSPGALRRSGG